MKTYQFKHNKSGRKIFVVFGYEADGDCFANFKDAQAYIGNRGKTPFCSFCSTDDMYYEADTPFTSGSFAIDNEQKDIYVRKYLREMEAEGWTIAA